MPSEPIPIRSSATDLLSRMSDRKGSNGESGVAIPYQPAASSSPSSTLSISPQTPFFPPPLASPPLVHGAGLSTTAPSGGFFKWASAFSKSPSIPEGLMGRSPRSSSSSQGSGSESDATPLAQKGFDIPEQNGGINTFGGGLLGPDDIEQESHDSFEVGDLNDIKSRSWNKNRRAVSMSLPRNQSGISAMLGNQFGGGGAGKEASPNGVGGSSVGPNGSMSPPIMPPGGVMADKAAKAQGVMRRISFSGGLSIPPLLSPPGQKPNPLNSAISPPPPANVPPEPLMPEVGAPIQRAATISGPPTGTERGRRRFSDSRKRGVSPMGERLLRDHGHF